MIRMMMALALGAAMLGGCSSGGGDTTAVVPGRLEVSIKSAAATHPFTVELAKTPAEQEKGLMYRTGIPKDEGMLFAPYPADGGGPREASFWMKNTPSSLDIIFIRADGTIARIAENTVPMSETPVTSGEPVAAVLEINGGRASELGIGEGDKVTWPGGPA